MQGYFWRSVIWFNDHWIAGAYSTLTQYTYMTSTDGSTWLPWNNGVQMYGMYGSTSISIDPTTLSSLFPQEIRIFG